MAESSVTKCQTDFFNIWPFNTLKIYPVCQSRCKMLLNKTFQNCFRFSFCQSGVISTNPVALTGYIHLKSVALNHEVTIVFHLIVRLPVIKATE